MNTEINYKNNPLNGVGLKKLLTEIVGHYGFQILDAYLNINCFKTNPSIESSIKFLKKTQWAREKVEAFYLYEYKNLPRASAEQFALSPRDRIVPDDQKPGPPAELSLEDAEQLREKRERKAAEWDQGIGRGSNAHSRKRSGYQSDRNDKRSRRDGNGPSTSSKSGDRGKVDPWAKWKT